MSASSPPLTASTDGALKGRKQTKNILNINYYSGTVLVHIVISTIQYWLNIHMLFTAYRLPHTVYHKRFSVLYRFLSRM